MYDVSVVKCENYEDVDKAVVKALNDINFKFKKNINVLVKPNVLGQHKPEEAVTTHPAVVESVCRILKENNCRVVIGDSSGNYFNGGTKKAFEVSGIAEMARKYNAKLINFESYKFRKIKDDKARVWKDITLSEAVFDADLIVNLPKLKTHSLTKYTGAVKNFFGTVPGALKKKGHLIGNTEEKFCNLLLDLYQNIKTPKLNIMDGVVGMEGNGPNLGMPKKTGVILASENAIALDAVAQKIIGIENVLTTDLAVKRNLFDNKINIINEVPLVKYKMPSSTASSMLKYGGKLLNLKFVQKQFMTFPKLNKDGCVKCGSCKNVCPVGAIELSPYPKFDKKKCISCFCCSEICPEKTIGLKKSSLIKVYDFVKKVK